MPTSETVENILWVIIWVAFSGLLFYVTQGAANDTKEFTFVAFVAVSLLTAAGGEYEGVGLRWTGIVSGAAILLIGTALIAGTIPLPCSCSA